MKKYNINWTAKTLVNQMGKEKVNFDNAVQRGLVWDNEKKSLLIHSMIYGYAIPAMFFVKDEDGIYDSLDGKQRSNAIAGYINGEYSLAADTPVVYDEDGNEVDISGMSYDSLPEWAQDAIKDYSLTIYYYEDMSDMEVREFFRRLNNGKPLSSVELTRVKAVSMDKFKALSKHDAIQVAVTDKGRKRFADENLAMQYCGMVYMPEVDFSTKGFRPWIQDAVITDENMAELEAGLSYVEKFINDYLANNEDEEAVKDYKRVNRKIRMKTHFVAMAYLGYLCAKCGDVDQSDFNKMVFDFYNCSTTSKDNDYNGTVGSGSAKPEAVQARKAAVDALFGKMPHDMPF